MSQPSEEHISFSAVRPRFRIETTDSIESWSEKIKQGLQKDAAPCQGQVSPGGFITLFLPKEEQHYWSPQLNVTMEKTDEGCIIRGLLGPRPTVWTMFVFFYFIIGFAALIISFVGFSYVSLGKPGTILWLVPVLILVFLSLYLVAYFGKKMGRNQMITLHKFFEESTGLKIE